MKKKISIFLVCILVILTSVFSAMGEMNGKKEATREHINIPITDQYDNHGQHDRYINDSLILFFGPCVEDVYDPDPDEVAALLDVYYNEPCTYEVECNESEEVSACLWAMTDWYTGDIWISLGLDFIIYGDSDIVGGEMYKQISPGKYRWEPSSDGDPTDGGIFGVAVGALGLGAWPQDDLGIMVGDYEDFLYKVAILNLSYDDEPSDLFMEVGNGLIVKRGSAQGEPVYFGFCDNYVPGTQAGAMSATADLRIVPAGGPPLIPDLDCEGELNWTDVEPGATVTGDFTVGNIGDPESLLNWEIISKPEWGDWTFDPSSGTGLTPEGSPISVDVEVKAPDEQNTVYEGEVKIVNSDDESDFCIIPVYLKTPVVHKSPLFQFLERFIERFPNAFFVLRYLLGL